MTEQTEGRTVLVLQDDAGVLDFSRDGEAADCEVFLMERTDSMRMSMSARQSARLARNWPGLAIVGRTWLVGRVLDLLASVFDRFAGLLGPLLHLVADLLGRALGRACRVIDLFFHLVFLSAIASLLKMG
jgi:hypothetical protein